MAHTLFKYLLNMIVIQRIIDHLAVSSVFDQGSLLKHPQLMRYGGLGHVQEIGNVTDTHLGLVNAQRIRILVESPNTLKNSAKS